MGTNIQQLYIQVFVFKNLLEGQYTNNIRMITIYYFLKLDTGNFVSQNIVEAHILDIDKNIDTLWFSCELADFTFATCVSVYKK